MPYLSRLNQLLDASTALIHVYHTRHAPKRR